MYVGKSCGSRGASHTSNQGEGSGSDFSSFVQQRSCHKRRGCRCLANLAANHDIQDILVKKGAMDPLIAGIQSDNSVAQRFGALGVANLASMTANQIKIVTSGATESIVRLVADPTKETGSRRYAALAIANLTATVGNHKALQAHNVCEALFQMTSVRVVFALTGKSLRQN